MTKITVVDGVVECPECSQELLASITVRLGTAGIAYDEVGERWKPQWWKDGAEVEINTIYCQNCDFFIRGDAIHTVDVEVWRDEFYEREKAEHDWRKFDEWQQRQQNGE